jgi:hypothetical protein
MSVTCLYTVVKNTSGNTTTFGFLPPHGVTLEANETYNVFGDIRNCLGGNQGGERSVQKRAYDALSNALDTGQLTIVSTTSPVLKDVTSNLPKELRVSNGTLSAISPCWD